MTDCKCEEYEGGDDCTAITFFIGSLSDNCGCGAEFDYDKAYEENYEIQWCCICPCCGYEFCGWCI